MGEKKRRIVAETKSAIENLTEGFAEVRERLASAVGNPRPDGPDPLVEPIDELLDLTEAAKTGKAVMAVVTLGTKGQMTARAAEVAALRVAQAGWLAPTVPIRLQLQDLGPPSAWSAVPGVTTFLEVFLASLREWRLEPSTISRLETYTVLWLASCLGWMVEGNGKDEGAASPSARQLPPDQTASCNPSLEPTKVSIGVLLNNLANMADADLDIPMMVVSLIQRIGAQILARRHRNCLQWVPGDCNRGTWRVRSSSEAWRTTTPDYVLMLVRRVCREIAAASTTPPPGPDATELAAAAEILDAAEELGIRARTMLHASEFIEMFEYQLRVVPGLSDCWNGFPPNPEIRAWHKVQCRGGVSLAEWNPETESWTLFVLDPEPEPAIFFPHEAGARLGWSYGGLASAPTRAMPDPANGPIPRC